MSITWWPCITRVVVVIDAAGRRVIWRENEVRLLVRFDNRQLLDRRDGAAGGVLERR